MVRKLGLKGVLVPALLVLVLVSGSGVGQEPPEANAPPQASAARRLPVYFSAVVTREQREKIYEIQAGYHERIAALQRQIAQLEMQRDTEVDGVLTAEQLQSVNQKRAEAAARRRPSSPRVTAENGS